MFESTDGFSSFDFHLVDRVGGKDFAESSKKGIFVLLSAISKLETYCIPSNHLLFVIVDDWKVSATERQVAKFMERSRRKLGRS